MDLTSGCITLKANMNHCLVDEMLDPCWCKQGTACTIIFTYAYNLAVTNLKYDLQYLATLMGACSCSQDYILHYSQSF